MSEQPESPPRADEDQQVSASGTAAGDPTAGLHLDRDEAPEVVSGDTGPEGNRQTALAPPID